MPVKQIRAMSALEALANVAVGYLLALATQILAFPLFGIAVTLRQNVLLGLIFLAISLARAYILRRLFEAWRWPRSRHSRTG
jgi:hypothetical protein